MRYLCCANLIICQKNSILCNFEKRYKIIFMLRKIFFNVLRMICKILLFVKIYVKNICLKISVTCLSFLAEQSRTHVEPIIITRINHSTQRCWKFEFILNRYKRGLETCPQANLHKSGREYFLPFFLPFFPTRMSDDYDSAPSRKYSRSLWCKFACIG